MDYKLGREFESYAALVRQQESLSQKKDYQMASEFLQAVGAVKTAVDGFKILAEYVGGIKDVEKRGELMRVIGNLSLELGQTKLKLNEKLQKITYLEKEVERLKTPQEELILYNNVYYTKENIGPYCPQCWESERKKNRITLRHPNHPCSDKNCGYEASHPIRLPPRED